MGRLDLDYEVVRLLEEESGDGDDGREDTRVFPILEDFEIFAIDFVWVKFFI